MNDNKYTVKLRPGIKHGFELKTFSAREDKIHYIGIWANMVQFKLLS